MPRSLRAGAALKKHQVAGAAWLYGSYIAGRRGCLLADDMGLGKTLQVLTFLPLLIENEPERAGPFIVVCPTILLENRTWFRDAEAFFEREGNMFQPWLLLHGTELKRMTRKSGVEAVRTDITGPAVAEMLKEIGAMTTHPLSVNEMTHSKDALVRSLPGKFEAAQSTAGTFSDLYIYDLGIDYWTKYPSMINAVATGAVEGGRSA